MAHPLFNAPVVEKRTPWQFLEAVPLPRRLEGNAEVQSLQHTVCVSTVFQAQSLHLLSQDIMEESISK